MLSISAGSSGVRMPEMKPPAATISRLLREVSEEAIAWVNAHSFASMRPMPTTAEPKTEGSARREPGRK